MFLNEKLYLDLENNILEGYKGMNINDDLFEMQKIYHRSIFDAYNEIITNMLNKKIKWTLDMSEVQEFREKGNKLKFILRKSKQILIESALMMCGLIKDKNDSLISISLPKYDMKAILFLREERMFKLVNYEFLTESENFFSFFQMFFINVSKFSLSNAIEEYLFEDLTHFIRSIL
jgi:hypothetical protein